MKIKQINICSVAEFEPLGGQIGTYFLTNNAPPKPLDLQIPAI